MSDQGLVESTAVSTSTVTVRKPMALVPARGGSKRFPRKNAAPFAGKPLIVWTIESAQRAEIFDRVWVSSEDDEICRMAEANGAGVLHRPPKLAEDVATLNDLLSQVASEEISRRYSDLYLLLPTSPLRKSESIRSAWREFVSSGADGLLSVVPLQHPPQWALVQEGKWLVPASPEEFELPRQKIVQAFRHDGGHAIGRMSIIRKTGRFLAERTLPFNVSVMESVDVNEPIDLAWAEFLLNRCEAKNG